MAATLPELSAALAAADKAGDQDGARRLAAAITHMQSNDLQLYEPPAEKMGFVEGVKESITGDKRKTKETETLPDWAGMPELNSLSIASAKTGVGTLLSSPKETAQIIKANYPDAKIRQDAKGNYLITSSIDGKEYAIKPGFQVSDIPRALGALVAFTPAGRAPTIAGMALKTGATQAGIEASQAATGGEFNPGEVAVATAVGGAVPAVVKAVQAAKAPVMGAIDRAMGKPPAGPSGAPEAPVMTPGATPPGPSPSAPAAPVTPPSAPVAPVAPVATMAAPELAATAKSAATGSRSATEQLAVQTAPDAKVIAAAKRLGIEDYLQPDHVTTNQAYRELAQAVKSVPGSTTRSAEIEGLNAVGKRADDLITEIGGTSDVSTLSANVKTRLQATQKELDSKAEDLFKQLRENIPNQTEAPAPNVLAFIKQRAEDLGGAKNLTAAEKTILAKLNPKDGKRATYALLDQVRKDLGSAGKMTGVFKDADVGLAKKLYGLLSQDQKAIAEAAGMGETFSAANAAVKTRKGVESDLASLFGKTLDSTIVGDLSGAVKSLPSGDSAKLVKLLKLIPEDMRQEVMATGLNTAFGKQVQNGSLNFNTYAKWYEGLLKNKQAYTAVMSNLPAGAQKQLSDLYRVSKGVSQATRERITTGRIQAVQQELLGTDSLISNLYNVAKRSAVGVAAEAVTTPLGAPGAGLAAGVASALTKGKPNSMKAVDALISSPEFNTAVRQYAGGDRQAAAARLAYSKPFTKFVRAVGNPKELSNREKWILQTLEAQNQVKEGK